MTESEVKAVRFIENIKNCAMVTLDHIAKAKEEPNVSPLVYKDREQKANTILAIVEEVQQYRAIGTVEECRAAVEKQIPKKPKHTYIKHGKHTWKKDKNGEIDNFAWDFDYHNGVVCEVCGETVCVHCNPNYDKLEDCEENIYSCPFCDKEVGYRQKYCDCGQKLDWGNE